MGSSSGKSTKPIEEELKYRIQRRSLKDIKLILQQGAPVNHVYRSQGVGDETGYIITGTAVTLINVRDENSTVTQPLSPSLQNRLESAPPLSLDTVHKGTDRNFSIAGSRGRLIIVICSIQLPK